jgi:hypothetical protein
MALQDPSLQDDLLEGFESVSLAPQRSESRSTMGGRDHPALHQVEEEQKFVFSFNRYFCLE